MLHTHPILLPPVKALLAIDASHPSHPSTSCKSQDLPSKLKPHQPSNLSQTLQSLTSHAWVHERAAGRQPLRRRLRRRRDHRRTHLGPYSSFAAPIVFATKQTHLSTLSHLTPGWRWRPPVAGLQRCRPRPLCPHHRRLFHEHTHLGPRVKEGRCSCGWLAGNSPRWRREVDGCCDPPEQSLSAGCSMTPTGKKSHNWTNKEDEKLLDVLIEQKAQGATQFEWSVVKALLKVEGIDRDATQIRNHYNDMVKKLKAWEWLIGQTGVGVNPTTGAVTVTDSTWERFLQQWGGRFRSFRDRVPPNLDKMKAVVHGRHASGDLSFSPAMGASSSQRRGVQQNADVGLEEHMGDSDEADADDCNHELQLSDGEESRSPPRTITPITRKCKSDAGSSGEGRRLWQELAESSVRNAKVQNALQVLRLKEESRLHRPPSNVEIMFTKLRQHPLVSARGPEFVFSVMEYVRCEQDFDYFVVFGDDDITRYLRYRGFGNSNCSAV